VVGFGGFSLGSQRQIARGKQVWLSNSSGEAISNIHQLMMEKPIKM
jgi:hypothetical protein